MLVTVAVLLTVHMSSTVTAQLPQCIRSTMLCNTPVYAPDFDVARAWLSALFLALVATDPTVPLDAPVSVPAIRPALLLASPSVRLLENSEL
jgi:hypothetical protein